ncbi:4Fe-4S binding protein [Megalodesulfovibrio paquesii]
MKILRPSRMERCIGCHSCSLACARQVYKQLSWTNCGIRIHSSGGITTGFEAKTCVACDPAPCAMACPTEAITQRQGGGVKLKQALCIRCGACAEACPVDAIMISPDDGLAYLCLHCGRCVAYCPHDCLELAEKDSPFCAPDTPYQNACSLSEK